jgi:uncharacterized glyoxalase superfamily protein PhnB
MPIARLELPERSGRIAELGRSGHARDLCGGRANADAHYARSKSTGADIVRDIKTQDYGGRDYTARDLEGHVWTFGTYDPWA